MSRITLIVAVVLSLNASAADLHLQRDFPDIEVNVEIFIPRESQPVQGLLLHVANHTLKTTGRWATLCRELGFAHVVASINRKANSRPRKLRQGIENALDDWAAATGLKGLPRVPRVGVGFSAGGMSAPMLMQTPEKMLANAASCSWVTDPEKVGAGVLEIPMLFIIGEQPDGFKMLPAIDKFYAPAVSQGSPWTLGLQHDCTHDWANSGTLFVPWVRAITRLRLPDGPVEPGQVVPLKTIDRASGWRGDRSTINGQFATVVPAAEYRGKPGDVVWLPDRATAYVWRAWQTKDSPIHLTASVADGPTLPAFNPRKSFGMSVPPNAEIALGVSGPADKLQFFYGDTAIAANWTPVAERAYAVWAQYEPDGKVAVTNPALICVEAK